MVAYYRRQIPSIVVLWLAWHGVVGGGNPLCPVSCTSKSSDRGKRRITCFAGCSTDQIPLEKLDARVEVLEVKVPENMRKQWLTITPVFQHFKHLEDLTISNSTISQIGMHAFWGVPSLKFLNLSVNNITAVQDHNFRGLVNLVELNLDENRIISLPAGVFKHLTELRILSIQRNQIQELVPKTFLKLTKLHVLKLSGNKFEDLSPEAFKEISELRVFECRKCGLSRINTQIYHLLPYLTYLDLGNNGIQFLSTDEFLELHRLHTLKLDGNLLPVVLENIFVNQHQLRSLNLARNRIVKVTDVAFKNLSSLIELDLGFNQISKVEETAFIHIAPTLQRLVISGNNFDLETIKTILRTLTKVVDLELEQLRISELPKGFIPERIRKLNLARNNLTHITPEILPKQLNHLNLSGNSLKGLNDSTLRTLESIKFVDVSGNPWKCNLCHISAILIRANKSDIFKRNFSVCASPKTLRNRKLNELNINLLPTCDSPNASGNEFSSDGINSFLIGCFAAVVLSVVLVVFVVYSCVKKNPVPEAPVELRKEKLRSRGGTEQHNNQYATTVFIKDQITFEFPLDLMERKISIATIDEVRKENGGPSLVNGGCSGL